MSSMACARTVQAFVSLVAFLVIPSPISATMVTASCTVVGGPYDWGYLVEPEVGVTGSDTCPYQVHDWVPGDVLVTACCTGTEWFQVTVLLHDHPSDQWYEVWCRTTVIFNAASLRCHDEFNPDLSTFTQWDGVVVIEHGEGSVNALVSPR